MGIRKKIGDAVNKWIQNSPAVEKSIESLVDKTKEVIVEDMNAPMTDEAKILAGFGIGALVLITAIVATKHPKAVTDIAEPLFRTVTINNYYGG